jgi:hypothetical protein
VRPYLVYVAPNDAHPMSKLPAVELDLRLAGSTARSDPTNLALEVRPGPGQTGQLILELRHLHLELGLASARPLGKDLDDQAGPIGDGALELLLEIALLNRAELVVHDDQIVVQLGTEILHLLDLAAPEVGRRLWSVAALDYSPHGHAAGGLSQAGELVE